MARPLEGKRVLITRAKEQAAEFSREIATRGGIPVEFPVIAFHRPGESGEINCAFERLPEFQWVIFTSANGVRFFFELLHQRREVFPKEVKVAAVGEKTGEMLQTYGVSADLIPDEFVAESLIKSLEEEINSGDAVLLARGNLARSVLPEALTKIGANVTDLVVYVTVENFESEQTLAELLMKHELDVITFTSSSTVNHFFAILKRMDIQERMHQAKIACIGPITAQTVRDHGLESDIVADEFSISGLLDALEQYYGEVSE